MCSLLQCKFPEAALHMCSSEKLFRKHHGNITNSMQKRSKITGYYPSVTSIRSKNSSKNMHFWECRLLWMVLILRL